MKRPQIYVDTSVFGGCFDAEFATWSNALMTDFRTGRFRLMVSDVTAVKKSRWRPSRSVSWNFKHIVRLDKIQLFNGTNIELGYRPLAIYTPREVATYGRED